MAISSSWLLSIPLAAIFFTVASIQISRYSSQVLACAPNESKAKVRRRKRESRNNASASTEATRNKAGLPSKADECTPICILYGTQTGTARDMAKSLERQIFACNVTGFKFKPSVCNLKYYDQDQLEHEKFVIFIISTWTDGKPPEDARSFIAWLHDMSVDFRIPKSYLSQVSHGVFGLGNAEYDEHYCTAAKELSKTLRKLGSQSILETGLGNDNVDQAKQFAAWSEELIIKLCEKITGDDTNNLKSASDKKISKKWLTQSQYRRSKKLQERESANDEGGDGDWEEEDRINDQILDDDEVDVELEQSIKEKSIVDVEDIGTSMKESEAAMESREMITPLQRKALTKEGYKIIGTHSAVKICRWTKHQLRGRGGCYKHAFYGITSYQCMETTPSLACANKCVFCWRHHKNPVGRVWRWKTDPADVLVKGAIEKHQTMLKELKGLPGLIPERWEEAFTVRHCALSLVGEPIMYPHINEFCHELHSRRISSFLVTNAQFPDKIASLDPITQLYVSVDAATKDALKAIDRPLFKDFWERFQACLKELRDKGQRTVYRLTLVKSYNMQDVEKYAQLIETGKPDFIEVKAVTYCGKSDGSDLTMKDVPWHEEVRDFCTAIASQTNEWYALAAEHAHSNCVLLAKKDFYIDGQWHTWIDYEKFHDLISQYYMTGKSFSSMEYIAPTPSWATYDAIEKGFDPEDTRHYRKNAKRRSEIRNQESGGLLSTG